MSSNRLFTSDYLKQSSAQISKIESSPVPETRSVISKILTNLEESKPSTFDPNKSRHKATSNAPAPSVSRFSTGTRVAAEDLKRLYDLQLSLLNNPNLLAQTQAAVSSKFGSSKEINELGVDRSMTRVQAEKNANEIGRLQKKVAELEFALGMREKSEQAEREKAARLADELAGGTALKQQLEELKFELKKTQGERDFHQQSHLELRKSLSAKGTAEFEVAQLKRELGFKDGEVERLLARNKELEDSLSELMLFAEKPRGEGSENVEAFFARRIVDLEAKLRNARGNERLNRIAGIVDDRLTGSDFPVPKEHSADREELEALRNEVSRLKEENLRLRTAPVADEKSENSELLRTKLAQAAREKTQLQLKIDELALQLSQKQRELLLQGNNQKGDPQLAETNKKLVAEVARLQETIRKIENLNRTSMYTTT